MTATSDIVQQHATHFEIQPVWRTIEQQQYSHSQLSSQHTNSTTDHKMWMVTLMEALFEDLLFWCGLSYDEQQGGTFENMALADDSPGRFWSWMVPTLQTRYSNDFSEYYQRSQYRKQAPWWSCLTSCSTLCQQFCTKTRTIFTPGCHHHSQSLPTHTVSTLSAPMLSTFVLGQPRCGERLCNRHRFE